MAEKIVVTGASGNIGSATLRELTTNDETRVLAIARRRPTGVQETALASVEWQCADVATDDLVPLFAGADAVVHLAWKFQPTHRQDVTWASNAVGTRRVLEAVALAEVPTVVCASSVAAYSAVDHDELVDEDWETDGTSEAAYCREKAYTERALDAFEASHPDIRVVRIRPAFVFQRSAASEQRRIFGGPLARPALLDRRRIPLLPVPTGLRFQAVHAGDVARAISLAARAQVTGPFNLAGDGILARRQLGELMGARTVDVPAGLARGGVELAWRGHLAQVPGSLLTALLRLPLIDSSRARRELGWQPRHTSAEALEAMLLGAPQRAGSDLPPLRP